MTSNAAADQLAYTNDIHLNTPWYRKAWFLSTIVGITMLVVVTFVFTGSSLARDVSRLAQESHSTNEVLRVASAVQTEFNVADGYLTFDTESNTDAVIEQSLDVAATGLTSLNQATEDPLLPIVVKEDLSAYVAVGQSHLADPVDGATIREVDESFEQLIATLTTTRASALAELEIVNRRMNSVAAIAAFVIAFLVPATGLYVWEAFRRTRTRQRMVERMLSDQLAKSQAVASELVGTVSDLQRRSLKLVTAAASEGRAAVLEQSKELTFAIDRLHRSAIARNPLETVNRNPSRLVDVVRGSVTAAMVPKLAGPSREELSEETIVVIDAEKMKLALVDLIRVIDGISATMALEIVIGESNAVVHFIHDGTSQPTAAILASIASQIRSAGGALVTEYQGGVYSLSIDTVAPTTDTASTTGPTSTSGEASTAVAATAPQSVQ